MTLQQVYDEAQKQVNHKKKAQDTCAFDLSCLFQDCFGIDRFMLSLHGTEAADRTAQETFFALLQRYLAGEPLQYLLGKWEFYGLPFYVGPGVLIPRPDTETLVETALGFLKELPAPTVADLCAGSGCIAVAIAQHCPKAQVFALEKSEEAFFYLTKNITHNFARVDAIQCDVLSPARLPLLDMVVSNPPYITAEEMRSLQTEVRFEPEMALFGGEDGLNFYRAIPELYYPLLKDGGKLLFEVGYQQSSAVAALLEQHGYRSIGIQNDPAGIARVVYGEKRAS